MSPSTPLDDVEFLARSEHRVEVLRTLASGARTRPDIHEETDIPQPTLGRILGDFEDRHWVERTGREYALTPFGDLVVEEFETLLDTVETIQKIGDVVGKLPTEEMDVDLRAFADATIWEPEPGDAFSHVRRVEELFYGADELRVLSPTIAPGSPEDRRERAAAYLDSDRVSEGIVSAHALAQEPLFDTDDEAVMQMTREILASGRTRFYVYDGPIPFLLMLADGTALLAPTDEHGTPTAVVETENETVRVWVEETLDQYRERSVAVTADDLPPPP